MLPDSALHQSLILVYAVLWGAATPAFGRLRVFAINSFDAKAWKRLAWGLLIGNVAPVAGLAFLMWLPKVGGFQGIAAGASMGLFPAVLPRLLHAVTASNESLSKCRSRPEAEQVLKAWDKQWFDHLPEGAWETDWNCLNRVGEAAANRRLAHLGAAAFVAGLPLAVTLLVVFLA